MNEEDYVVADDDDDDDDMPDRTDADGVHEVLFIVSCWHIFICILKTSAETAIFETVSHV